MVFLNCNLDTGQESYGLENTGISRGTGISRATGNSRNSGIPEAQTFPARFPGNGNFPGISRPWFPVEHPSTAYPTGVNDEWRNSAKQPLLDWGHCLAHHYNTITSSGINSTQDLASIN